MERPRVVVYAVATVDGRVALGPNRPIIRDPRSWQALCGPSIHAIHEAVISTEAPQVILEGSGTFVCEAETPAQLPPTAIVDATMCTDYLPEEVVHREGHKGWYAVVDSRGRCRWGFKEQNGWHLLLLVAHNTPADYLAYLRSLTIPYLVVGDDRVNLEMAMCSLAERLGVRSILSESGGGLNGALLRAGLVDEINLVVVPALIGGRDTPTVFDATELTSDESPTRVTLISAQPQSDGNVWLRYRLCVN